ncbi:acetyltransferase [Tumebacillus permanentifrigoris]|uniref:Acetyltransferase EpsM n=1 Tax=Tumebacillus permanentifrigoris TaxID=378543 RepID=A0A316DT29_9BACL|nr:acetyltransferase [Tumebacillus permanentifrigoris]PWK09689.1 acetyltransferase EpsM [Tumebacillus permanentifrigoris]
MADLILIGMGGHSKVVADIARRCGHLIVGYLDDREPARPNPLYLGSVALAVTEGLGENRQVVIAVGDNLIRKKIVQSLRDFPLAFATLIDPSAILGSNVEIGAGSVVMPGAILNADTVVGRHAILNTAATVDHDGVIGDYAHLSPGVHLAGAVTVGEGAHLGTGALAIPGVRIGAWSTIGAGATVIREIPAAAIAVGVPAVVKSFKKTV